MVLGRIRSTLVVFVPRAWSTSMLTPPKDSFADRAGDATVRGKRLSENQWGISLLSWP